ncbi:hypothetical protein RIF29_00789 [Crotalaria pallida]|uniref:Uncharacterized protein n=1 Tax=Crotalaria pallida TaxID=3830 RepID=A0AAN9P6R0_CROPI
MLILAFVCYVWCIPLHVNSSSNLSNVNVDEYRNPEESYSNVNVNVLAFVRALVVVMEALSNDADPSGVGGLIMEELRKIKNSSAALSAELTPYNIVPLEAPSLTNPIRIFPEVKGAISAIRYTEHIAPHHVNKRGGKVKLQSIVMPLCEFDHDDKGDALHGGSH